MLWFFETWFKKLKDFFSVVVELYLKQGSAKVVIYRIFIRLNRLTELRSTDRNSRVAEKQPNPRNINSFVGKNEKFTSDFCHGIFELFLIFAEPVKISTSVRGHFTAKPRL